MPGIDFERYEPLRGSMVTDAGWDALVAFVEEPRDIVVVDEAFTKQCEGELTGIGKATLSLLDFREVNQGKRNVIELASFLGDVSTQVYSAASLATIDWHDEAGSILPHIDVNQGHTVLGFFNVRTKANGESPYLTTHSKRRLNGSLIPLMMAGGGPAKAPFDLRGQPRKTILRSRQMVLLSGEAAIGEDADGGQCHVSVPHGVVVPAGASRARLMVYTP